MTLLVPPDPGPAPPALWQPWCCGHQFQHAKRSLPAAVDNATEWDKRQEVQIESSGVTRASVTVEADYTSAIVELDISVGVRVAVEMQGGPDRVTDPLHALALGGGDCQGTRRVSIRIAGDDCKHLRGCVHR